MLKILQKLGPNYSREDLFMYYVCTYANDMKYMWDDEERKESLKEGEVRGKMGKKDKILHVFSQKLGLIIYIYVLSHVCVRACMCTDIQAHLWHESKQKTTWRQLQKLVDIHLGSALVWSLLCLCSSSFEMGMSSLYRCIPKGVTWFVICKGWHFKNYSSLRNNLDFVADAT